MKNIINTTDSFLPNFCTARMTLIVVIMAELLAIILALSDPNHDNELVYHLALQSLFIQLIALSCAASLCIGRRFLNQLPSPMIALISYGLILLVSFLIIELVWHFMHNEPYLEGMKQSHMMYSIRCLTIAAITGALVLRYLYVQHQWRNQIEAESKARIEALQARIRPHFLFNCMNTIASLTRKSPELAEESIENLSALFRASLQKTEQLSTLEKEFELCKQYLSIEQHRLGDRLQCDWQVDPLPLDTRIPTLTLQPLIENAIYHGIEPLASGGTVTIQGREDDKHWIISIHNPIDKRLIANREGNRIAQENVRQRLTTYYDNPNCFRILESDDDYRVEISIAKA